MMYVIFKWICFIVVCLDLVSHILEFSEEKRKPKNISSFIGMMLGIVMRVFLLYGACRYWVMV